MSQEPHVQARAAQHYAGIRMTVTMGSLSAAVDEAFPELFGWLASHGIAVSGFGAEEDRRLSREAGFFEHLTKPVDLGRLEAAIHRATSRAVESENPGEPFSTGLEMNGSPC